jgi:hypothetical protein
MVLQTLRIVKMVLFSVLDCHKDGWMDALRTLNECNGLCVVAVVLCCC